MKSAIAAIAITVTVVVLCTTINAQSQHPGIVRNTIPTVEECRATLKLFKVMATEDIKLLNDYRCKALHLKAMLKKLQRDLEWQPIRIQQAEDAAKKIKRKPGESKEDRDAAKKKAKEKIAAAKMFLQVLPGQIRQLQVEYDANTKEYKAAVEQLLKALESKK